MPDPTQDFNNYLLTKSVSKDDLIAENDKLQALTDNVASDVDDILDALDHCRDNPTPGIFAITPEQKDLALLRAENIAIRCELLAGLLSAEALNAVKAALLISVHPYTITPQAIRNALLGIELEMSEV